MSKTYLYDRIKIALLITGSAILLCGCSKPQANAVEENYDGMISQLADSLTMIQSDKGRVKYRFFTPLMESYEYAREPYREFRKGVDIITYDSTGMVESTLVADYAIQFTNQELWEAKGNVVGTNAKGHILETQQLFWNQRTGRIYSNIDTKITQQGDVIVGVGFESDDKFEVWEFRRPRGTVTMEVEPTRDSTATASVPAGDPGGTPSQPSTPQTVSAASATAESTTARSGAALVQEPDTPALQSQTSSQSQQADQMVSESGPESSTASETLSSGSVTPDSTRVQ